MQLLWLWEKGALVSMQVYKLLHYLTLSSYRINSIFNWNCETIKFIHSDWILQDCLGNTVLRCHGHLWHLVNSVKCCWGDAMDYYSKRFESKLQSTWGRDQITSKYNLENPVWERQEIRPTAKLKAQHIHQLPAVIEVELDLFCLAQSCLPLQKLFVQVFPALIHICESLHDVFLNLRVRAAEVPSLSSNPFQLFHDDS